MMVAMFSGNPSKTIISCYSPTNANDETDFNAFCNELSSLVHSISKHNILIIGGDMNAQMGKNMNNKFSLCYITYDMDYQFVPSDPVCFGKLSYFD